MKKTIMASILEFVLLNGFGPLLTQAGAETMNIKLVSMYEKIEWVKVTQTEGVNIGMMNRKGLSIFENGEIATTSCRGLLDTKKGWQGYSSMVFEDGSTLVLSWKGPTSYSRSADGKYVLYGVKFEYADGTGRFKGIKGNGTFNGKTPQWDEDYKAKGFAYYEFNGTYTLPSK
jgi:hypothetical protein